MNFQFVQDVEDCFIGVMGYNGRLLDMVCGILNKVYCLFFGSIFVPSVI